MQDHLKTPKTPEVAMILEDDGAGWDKVYQALFVPQLMTSANERWSFYNAYQHQFPSEEVLQKVKVIVMPGSA